MELVYNLMEYTTYRDDPYPLIIHHAQAYASTDLKLLLVVMKDDQIVVVEKRPPKHGSTRVHKTEK